MATPEEKPSRASVEASLAGKLPVLAHFPPGMVEQHLERCAQKALPDATEQERAEFRHYWRERLDRERDHQDREPKRGEQQRQAFRQWQALKDEPPEKQSGDLKPGGDETTAIQPGTVVESGTALGNSERKRRAAQASMEPNAGDGESTGTTGWQAIEIWFVSDERVQIQNGPSSETLNYDELGFADNRTEGPKKAWKTLRELAQGDGIISQIGTVQRASRPGNRIRVEERERLSRVEDHNRAWANGVEKRIQEIRKVLRKHFRIPGGDPIPFVPGIGYRACFKIGCRRSFDS
jgi:hypothetical protein